LSKLLFKINLATLYFCSVQSHLPTEFKPAYVLPYSNLHLHIILFP